MYTKRLYLKSLEPEIRYEGESFDAFKSATLTINDNPIMKTKTVWWQIVLRLASLVNCNLQF